MTAPTQFFGAAVATSTMAFGGFVLGLFESAPFITGSSALVICGMQVWIFRELAPLRAAIAEMRTEMAVLKARLETAIAEQAKIESRFEKLNAEFVKLELRCVSLHGHSNKIRQSQDED